MHRSNSTALSSVDLVPVTWRDLFEKNLDAFFQTALLLVADPEEAEATMLRAIEELDFSRPPAQDEIVNIQNAIVLTSVRNPGALPPIKLARARRLLQPDLWPVLELRYAPRLCFVLRLLLGYATSSCAQMLGMEENGVRVLLQTAVLQLRHSVNATTSDLSCSVRP